MLQRAREIAQRAYTRLLERELSDAPSHVAVIQDGNRRYARKNGDSAPSGHEDGAETTEQVLKWCRDQIGRAHV